MDRRRFLAVLGTGLFITGCGGPAASPTAKVVPTTAPAPTASPPQPVAPTAAATSAPVAPTPSPVVQLKAKLAYFTPSLPASLHYVGKEKGYFRDEGVDLELQQVPAANTMKAMLAGEIEFTSASGTAIASIVNGAPLKVIFLTARGPLAWLYAKPQIKSIADLRGGTIAITAPGDFSHNMARAALGTAKLDAETDVTYLAIGGASQNRLQAVVAGSADAVVLSTGDNLVAEQQGLSRLLFLGDAVKISSDGAATTDALIKEKPDLVRRFIRASVKALVFLKSNKAGALPLMATFMNVEREQVSRIYDSAISGFTDDGWGGDDTLATTLESQKQVSQVTQSIPLSSAFDLTFTKQAMQDLKASGWKP